MQYALSRLLNMPGLRPDTLTCRSCNMYRRCMNAVSTQDSQHVDWWMFPARRNLPDTRIASDDLSSLLYVQSQYVTFLIIGFTRCFVVIIL